MSVENKVSILQEISKITEEQIKISQELIILSKNLESDKENNNLINEIKALTKEKNTLYQASKELEKKIF